MAIINDIIEKIILIGKIYWIWLNYFYHKLLINNLYKNSILYG